jgi:hypothetical protein
MWPSYTMAGWFLVPLIGLVFVLCGYFALTVWIPNSLKKAQARTDLYSSGASLSVIWVGLFLIVLWAVSAVAIRFMAMHKAIHAP